MGQPSLENYKPILNRISPLQRCGEPHGGIAFHGTVQGTVAQGTAARTWCCASP